MNIALVSLLARTSLMHHADPSVVYQPPNSNMMLESNIGELLTRAELMHHDDQEHDTLKHYEALKGLKADHLQIMLSCIPWPPFHI